MTQIVRTLARGTPRAIVDRRPHIWWSDGGWFWPGARGWFDVGWSRLLLPRVCV